MAEKLEITEHISTTPESSSYRHVAGETRYIDDMEQLIDELHVGLVYSPHAKARILSIEITDALKHEDVVCVLTSKDLIQNRFGAIFHDQPLLADVEVNYVGEIVAVVATRTKESLRAATALVRVSYSPSQPILSIQDAKFYRS